MKVEFVSLIFAEPIHPGANPSERLRARFLIEGHKYIGYKFYSNNAPLNSWGAEFEENIWFFTPDLKLTKTGSFKGLKTYNDLLGYRDQTDFILTPAGCYILSEFEALPYHSQFNFKEWFKARFIKTLDISDFYNFLPKTFKHSMKVEDIFSCECRKCGKTFNEYKQPSETETIGAINENESLSSISQSDWKNFFKIKSKTNK